MSELTELPVPCAETVQDVGLIHARRWGFLGILPG